MWAQCGRGQGVSRGTAAQAQAVRPQGLGRNSLYCWERLGARLLGVQAGRGWGFVPPPHSWPSDLRSPQVPIELGLWWGSLMAPPHPGPAASLPRPWLDLERVLACAKVAARPDPRGPGGLSVAASAFATAPRPSLGTCVWGRALWGTPTTAPTRLPAPAPSPPQALLQPAGWGQGGPPLTCLTGGPAEAIWALAAEAGRTVCAGPTVLARVRRTLVHTCRWGGGGASVEEGRLGGSVTPGARGQQASRALLPGRSAPRGRCSTTHRLTVTEPLHLVPSGAPHTPRPPRGQRPLTLGSQGPWCSHSVPEPGGDSPRWQCLPVKPEGQEQVYEGLPVTQSSMHVPPLRHGRRARHTEAADTGPSRAVTPFPP